MLYTLAIQNNNGFTTGEYRADTAPAVGDTVTVNLHDQNGQFIAVTGAVVEILDIREC
jgi:hypothetical protein